jgi:two-component system response regulator YesN
MYTVLLVDDEPRAIEGLQWFVDWERLGFRICGICENGKEALDSIGRLEPDVVVTDIRMPGMDGLDMIGHCRSVLRKPPEFVILSGYSEFAYAKRALRLGVRHYLLKPVMEEEASEVLKQVHDGLRRRAANGDSDNKVRGSAALPEEAARRISSILEAIERLEAAMAEERIRASFAWLEREAADVQALFAAQAAFRISRLVQDLEGDIHSLVQSDGTLPAAAGVSRLAQQAIEAIRAVRVRQPGNTLSRVEEFVQAHYREPLTIKSLAAQFYLNPVYLGKAYQDKYGQGALDRIHDLRIEEAERLLRETDEIMGAVAERVGYAHYHHFLRHFERRTGLKPAEYRATARRGRES